jgi:hypothetical protein
MKSWFWSTMFFLLGYAIATVVGFSLYYVSVIVMWVGTFTLMPIVFVYLFYLYLRKVRCEAEESLRETVRVVIYWAALSFLLDALVYIAVVPAVFGVSQNWRFFIDQSPWIWLCYMVMLVVGLAGRWLYVRNSA